MLLPLESARIASESIELRTFREDVIAGLSAQRKSLPCKYFYDARGSALFDSICELPEYYPTRTEIGIMHDFGNEIVNQLSGRSALIEFGSGSSCKTRILLDRAKDIVVYVPIDISGEHLYATASGLRQRYPRLEVLPLCADYTKDIKLSVDMPGYARPVIYFPGSTIGNFHPSEAKAFLASMARLCGPGGGLLIGVDLIKEQSVLERAYNDQAGVTAMFNRNLLLRINTELRGTFDLRRFAHSAYFNTELERIEMHLVSEGEQEVWIGGSMFKFYDGESIWTESSYKYTLDGFALLALSSGWTVKHVWTDQEQLFSVQYLTADSCSV